ncbi:MAG: hypothetical protein Q9162_002108 [Coniocarpon cinnabarinum]
MASQEHSEEKSEKPKDQQLKELIAAASHDYAHKNYEAASELYAQAAEIQDEINGEMNPENAELLYAYGRCLHHYAVSNSDVLGGKVAGASEDSGNAKKAGKKRKRGQDAAEGSSTAARGAKAVEDAAPIEGDEVAEKVVEKVVEGKEGMQVAEQEKQTKQESKPFFQIKGDDAEWEDDSEAGDEEAEDAAEDEAEEEEDDLATAFEVLDVARVLMERQIEGLRTAQGKTKDKVMKGVLEKGVSTAKERLADTHDLQAEISLENERFADAVSDARASLALKQELFDETDGQVGEAHFKLSLALELGSVTTTKDENGIPVEGAAQKVDQPMRDEAASAMEAAIRSTKMRLDKETKAMKELTGDKLKKKQEEKKDVEEIITEMEQRDLRSPPASVNNTSGPAGAPQNDDALRGILGEVLGESPEAFKARITEASKGANDLTGIVKHKKKSDAEPQATGDSKDASKSNGKRKAAADDSEDELAGNKQPSKRTKNPAV